MKAGMTLAAGLLGWMSMFAVSVADPMVMPAGQAYRGDHGGHWRHPPPRPAHEPPAVIWNDPGPGCRPPTPQVAVQSVEDFYEPLGRHGRWINLHPYGWVWQPEIARVDQDWRPYHHGGRWVVTAGTWYWQSDYPWGWATFHYGRWIYSAHHGWTWLPDATWAPAWVQWRGTDSHVGWAPLPPESRYEIGVGYTYGGNTVGFEFHLEFSDNDYTYTPCRRPPVIHTTEYVPVREPRVIYRQSPPPPWPVMVAPPPPPFPTPRGQVIIQGGRRSSGLQALWTRPHSLPSPPTRRAPHVVPPPAVKSSPRAAPAPSAHGKSRGERLSDLLRGRR